MLMRIKAREKNLLLTCRSANKVEQVKTFKDRLRDTTKRKSFSNYQKVDERERLDINSRKRSKTLRKSHSEKQMKIPIKESMTIKETAKVGPVSINDSNEDDYKNSTNNVKRQTQNNSIKYIADERPSHLNESYETAIRSKESNRQSDGPDRKGDSANKVIFVSLNFTHKSDEYDNRRKPTNHIRLRRLWKNLQHISSYHRKQKIGRLRKYCCRKPTSIIRKDYRKNESNRNSPENETIPTRQDKTKETNRINGKKTRGEKPGSIFETESDTTNNSKTEHNTRKETSKTVIDEGDRELLNLLNRKDSHFMNNLTPKDDVSKIDEKYLKYILLITNPERLRTSKNNENQENMNKSENRDEGIAPKGKKSVNVLKAKTSQNQLKSKQTPSNTLKDNNQSKDYSTQNKKNFIDHKIESEFKPTRESIISDQQTQKRKKVIVLKLSSTKQSDRSGNSRANHVKKESGPANVKEDKNTSRKSNSKNPNSQKKETTPPRGEVSKFEFVEIWRRNSRKDSQDSLSSHSSTDPPDNQERLDEDSSDCEYLGIRSYQALKNIVEQEVLKIFTSHKQKQDVENERKKTEPETADNTKPPLPIVKKSGRITVEKAQIENKLQPDNKQVTVAKDDSNDVKRDCVMETKINLPPQKGKIPPENQNFKKQDNETENLRVITRNNSEELNKKLKILSEQENKDFKIPSEIIKNWTIMHRLETAFLALGTPNFHSKSLPLTKPRVIGGKVTNAQNEKVGAGKTKTKTGGASVGDESKTNKPCVNAFKIKIPQKKPDAKYLGRPETEQKVKKIPTEKDPSKGSKKDGGNVQDLLHSLKSAQAPLTKKSVEDIKKPDGILLSKDHKTKIKKRFKPDILSRVPRKALENIDTKKKQEIEKPNQTQEVSVKPIPTSVKPEPIYEDDSDDGDNNDNYLDCKVAFSIDPDELSTLGFNHVTEIENDFAEEAKHFDSQIEKLLDLKSSRNLLFKRQNQNKIEGENLERKKTFAIFPIAETLNLKSKKSQSCHELEVKCKTDSVKCSCSTTSQKCNDDYWDPFEQNNKRSTREQYSGSNISRKDQNSFSKTQLFLKMGKKPSFKTDDYVSDKTNIYNDEEVTLTKPSEVQPNKENMPVEDISHKLLFSQIEVNLNKRVVKERSILSLGQNLKKTQRKPSSETIKTLSSTEEYGKPRDKTTPDVFLQRIFHTNGPQINYSNMSAISTATYDVIPESNIGCDYPGHQTQKQIVVSSKLRPAPLTDNISTTTFKESRLSRQPPSSLTKKVKIQPNWERDIRQYRAIVKDIIDQYKRTKGFLKQNEPLLNPTAGAKFIECQGQTSLSSNFRFLDINEYRKKIVSEYRDLSIFEYKSKIQETSNPEEKKTDRGLAVVKEVTPETDYDIKDFQPNVKKVLNSQIYVDQNHFYKLKCLRVKSAEQNPSLQDVMLGTSKLGSQQIKLNEQSKSAHIPKSNVSLPNSKVYSVLFHTPNLSNVEVDNDFSFDDVMSLSEFEETESDFTDYH